MPLSPTAGSAGGTPAQGVRPPAPSPASRTLIAISGLLRGSWRLHAATPARAIISLASLIALLRSGVFVYQHFVLPAWFDIWRWVEDFQRYVDGRFTFHDLVKLHNEHRIVTTRLLLLLDSLAFDMNGRSVVIINLALLAGVGLLVWRLVGLDGVKRSAWVAPPLFWAALLCSVCQSFNLMFAFQVQFAITCLAACGAASLLTAAAGAPLLRSIWLAILAGWCAVVAAFSMGAGILLAPALCILLLLRRASRIVWAVFAPICGLGIALYFYHYDVAGPAPPLFAWNLTLARLLYAATFLATSLNAFPNIAAFAGLCGLTLFALAMAILLRSHTARGKPFPAGDAALAALGLFVVACALAGTLTFRIAGGPAGALVPRYATMSLLFGAALLGLLMRWCARAGWPPWCGTAVQLVTALPILWIVNVPFYDRYGDGLRRAVNGEAQLLVNNIGMDGPIPVDFFGYGPPIQNAAAFLHARQLNMFAPENGPPAALIAQLRRIGPAALPACLGAIDAAYAIDGTGFLLTGWVENPQGKRTADWIATLDTHGNILGTARSLRRRFDLPGRFAKSGRAYGFDAGFRLAGKDDASTADEPRSVSVIGLFPGARQPLCALPAQARIGPILVEPVAELLDLAPAASTPTADGFMPWTGTSGDGGTRAPGGGQAWHRAAGAGGTSTLQFRVANAHAANQALVVPFVTGDQVLSMQVSFTMADGARFDAQISPLWGRDSWQAAVLPAQVLARHGGVATIRITGQDDPALVVGAPLVATLHPAWSRIF